MRAPITGLTIALGRKNLYMLPTASGLLFSLMVLVLLLTSINYNNGLVYALTFLLISMALVSMLYTHRNLSGLQIKMGECKPSFAQQFASFIICLKNTGTIARLKIKIKQDKTVVTEINLKPQQELCVPLLHYCQHRGYADAPSFTVQSSFPLGLLYTWSRKIKLDQRCLIYPKPSHRSALFSSLNDSGVATQGAQQDGDDFAGLRKFQIGDLPQHISWKTFARGAGMYTKQFKSNKQAAIWLDWQQFSEQNTELKLSMLCKAIIEADKQNVQYGLRIHHMEITPGQGTLHRHRCLKTLALFPTS